MARVCAQDAPPLDRAVLVVDARRQRQFKGNSCDHHLFNVRSSSVLVTRIGAFSATSIVRILAIRIVDIEWLCKDSSSLCLKFTADRRCRRNNDHWRELARCGYECNGKNSLPVNPGRSRSSVMRSTWSVRIGQERCGTVGDGDDFIIDPRPAHPRKSSRTGGSSSTTRTTGLSVRSVLYLPYSFYLIRHTLC